MQAHACAASTQPGSLPVHSYPAIRLYAGGHGRGWTDLTGDRCFSAAHDADTLYMEHPAEVTALLDSGAFTDKPERRLTTAAALTRQLEWEAKVGARSGMPAWQAHALVSYDLLIDETHVAGKKHKRRWSVAAAERAVGVTVDAAAYLASQRQRLAPRQLVLSCQGVDAQQYAACTEAVLRYATPADWIGLGGWCILGRFRSWLPTFWATLYAVLPEIAAAGVRHVHLFGVLYLPALGGLLWLADRHGLTVSTDSSAPLRSATPRTEAKRRKAGCRVASGDYHENLAWWTHRLATLRASSYYREPPHVPAMRQLTLLSA